MFQLYVQYISVMQNRFQSLLKNFGFYYHSFLLRFKYKYAHVRKIITELKPFHIDKIVDIFISLKIKIFWFKMALFRPIHSTVE